MDFSLRRSIYGLGKDIGINRSEVEAVLRDVLLTTPSAFNSQTARILLLWGKESDEFWDIAENELRKIVPADSFSSTHDKISSFRAGAGTILFYDESATITALQEQFPSYADNFPVWALEAGGMVQFAVWNQFAEMRIGASLQHYNPLVDDATAKRWNIPATWKLRAQMPFGKITAPGAEKNTLPVSDRLKVYAS